MQVTYELFCVQIPLVFSSAHSKSSEFQLKIFHWPLNYLYLSLTPPCTTPHILLLFANLKCVALAVEKNRQMSLAAAMHC